MATTTDTTTTNGKPEMEKTVGGDAYKMPDEKTLHDAGEIPVQDESGKEVPFKTLYENKPGRQLIVFIRHFFCGTCEDYIRHLTSTLTPSVLSATSPPTTLTIVGCGQHEPIQDYKSRTNSKDFTYYCDPSRALYTKLGMVVNLSAGPGGSRPEWRKSSLPSVVLSSVKNMVVSGGNGFRGGKASQNGGELLFEDGKLVWMHRMQHTQDHVDVKELKGKLGITA